MRVTERPVRNAGRGRARRLPMLALAVLTTSTALAWQSAGGDAARAPLGAAVFVSTCSFSHRSPDDPIVYPRAPGFSHDHTFVGNVSTSAFSTLATLRSAGTTCAPTTDKAAYWAPTLYHDGRPITPRGADVYYRRLTTVPVRPFPAGLRMVAGSSRAIRPQSPEVTYWDCSVFKENFYGPRRIESAAAPSEIPRCSQYSSLQLRVNFPDCWNGTTLDSTDHRSHMAYSVAGRCPRSHPVALPAIGLVYNYLPPGPGTLSLSSGGQYSAHADFINTWNVQALKKLVATCLNGGAYCKSG